MGNDFASRHEGYRKDIDRALDGVPASARESVRRGVYEVIERIYTDCARFHLEKPFGLRRAEDLVKKLGSEVGDLLGREDPALRLLRNEANIYSTLAKGEKPHKNPDYVFGKVRNVLVDQLILEPKKVHMDSSLVGELGPDSLDIVEIGMELEDEFGIRIPEGDLSGFRTVSDIVSYIVKCSG